MPHTISFSEEIDKINDAFPVVLYCANCDHLRLMKIERGSDKFAHRCTACGAARCRAGEIKKVNANSDRTKPTLHKRMFVGKELEPVQSRDWDVRATKAIEQARKMPLGHQRCDALQGAGRLRIAAEMHRWLSTK
jgi:hypothetical protein